MRRRNSIHFFFEVCCIITATFFKCQKCIRVNLLEANAPTLYLNLVAHIHKIISDSLVTSVTSDWLN